MIGNDPRPHYAHQTNIMSDSTNSQVANRGDGILFAVIGEAVKRYRAYFKTSFQQPTQTAATQELKRQLAWTAAVAANQVTGYIQDGKATITASAENEVRSPADQRRRVRRSARAGQRHSRPAGRSTRRPA